MAKLSLIFSFILLLLHSANSIYFKISRFDPDLKNIAYEGDAASSGGNVSLTNVDFLFRVGWVTYAESVRLWDSSTGKLSDFTTNFSFVIDTLGRSPYGDGMAFFLAPAGYHIPPNSGGGFLGLYNTSTYSPHNKIVHVEFDSFANALFEANFEHVGINYNSINSSVSTPWNASFHSGDIADARINYDASTKNLTVSWTYHRTSNSSENSSLSYAIDLMKILPEWITIGFSAATGSFFEKHTLLSWEFSSSLNVKEKNGKSSKNVRIIIGVAVSACFVIGGIIIAFCMISWRRKQIMRGKAEAATNWTSINEDLERAGPRKFSYQELACATNKFSNERKLGEGGSGAVYKGYLNDADMTIAVKKISRGKQGKKDYHNELKTISRLRHRNLVQLIGWCHDDARGDFLLVYEFMPNGSLDSHLFGKKVPLTWAVRYRAALGLASALLYLHEEWEQCVLHRDVKSSNIMLDSSFNIKLGDFGLARLVDHELGPKTTGLAGTRGYMAPEYINTGRASKESDVYSFGVVALEIATGRNVVGAVQKRCEISLVEWVWDLYGTGKLGLAIDDRLRAGFDEKQGECLMVVGLWCAYPDHNLRPSIKQAIQVLNFEAQLPNLPTKMPKPTYHAPAAAELITYSSL